MEMLFQRNDRFTSLTRASYAQTAFEARLIQQLPEVWSGQQKLFLTDLPMHIILSISEDSTSKNFELLKLLRGMIKGMMAHGLSTRFAIKKMLAAITENYVVDKADDVELQVHKNSTRFLQKWWWREHVVSKQRMALIQKFLAQVN